MTYRLTRQCLILGLILLLATPAASIGQDAQTPKPAEFCISVELSREFSREAVSGRLFLLVTTNLIGEPRHLLHQGGIGFVFTQDVKNWKPGTTVTFSGAHAGFPSRLNTIPPGRYNLQAVLDRHPTDREITTAAGNGRSRPKRLAIDTGSSDELRLSLNREIIRNKLQNISRVEYRKQELRSVGRETETRTWATCAIVLPPNYKHDKEKTYPIQYWIPDFGTSARSALNFFQAKRIFNPSADIASKTEKFIHVLIDPHSKNGHHFWMNSDANGPYRTALMDELIPQIESAYRVRPGASSRFLVGIGAGGWAAVNLIIDRPDFFGGVWALAPDTPSGKSFLGMALWTDEPHSLFMSRRSEPRAMVQDPQTSRTILTVRAQSQLETILGRGNKLGGYEAAISPTSLSGRPAPMFNRDTGLIKDKVAHWKRFDLAHKLKTLPKNQGLKVARLIHIKAGRLDPYGMVPSTEAFKEQTDAMGLGIDITIQDDATRESVSNSVPVHNEVQQEISRAFRATK